MCVQYACVCVCVCVCVCEMLEHVWKNSHETGNFSYLQRKELGA